MIDLCGMSFLNVKLKKLRKKHMRTLLLREAIVKKLSNGVIALVVLFLGNGEIEATALVLSQTRCAGVLR